MPILVIALGGALVIASRAWAQAPLEVGGGLAFVQIRTGGDSWGEGLKDVGAEVHATVSMTKRFGLDVSTTLGQRALPNDPFPGAAVTGGDKSRTEGMYAVAIQQRIARSTRPGFHAFVTYGLAGLFGTTFRTPVQVSYPNGNVFDYPAYTNSHVVGIIFPVLGGGIEKTLTKHLALRADARILFFIVMPEPVGFRASVTATVLIGKPPTP